MALCPRRSFAPSATRSPTSVSSRVVLPEPLAPTRQTCSPRSSHIPASSISVLSPTSIRASSSSSATLPERSALPNEKASVRRSRGSLSIAPLRMRSICLSFDCAWRALVAL